MKRLIPLLTLFAALVLTVPFASAQEHHHHPPKEADQAEKHAGHDGHMEAMTQLHERIMADGELHQALMADEAVAAGMKAMMHLMMDHAAGEHDMDAMHARMMNASPEERKEMMAHMHARMKERMAAMTEDQHQTMMRQMMSMHARMMEVPAMQARLQADPELRRLMEAAMAGHEQMHGEHEGMNHEGMNHEGMNHEGMNHEGMNHEGMDHDEPGHAMSMDADEKAAAEAASRTADRFYRAIAGGDRAAVEALVLTEALILEGGGVETRAEYLGGHFGSDGAFLSAVERTPLTRRTHVAGEVAWVSSTSRLAGTYRDRDIDIQSAELLVLRRDAAAPEGWRIAAVHWSSGTAH